MKQTYKYCANKSITCVAEDEYSLSQNEYALLYSFYVTYSLCDNQSAKRRTFIDYGWKSNNITAKNGNKEDSQEIMETLKKVIDFNANSNYVFTEADNLKELFEEKDLQDGVLNSYDLERAVIGCTSENNKYLKLFHRIRDGFAHGKFLLKLSSNYEKMVVIQDDNGTNITARIIVKLSTLLDFIKSIDKNEIIRFELDQKEQIEIKAQHVA